MNVPYEMGKLFGRLIITITNIFATIRRICFDDCVLCGHVYACTAFCFPKLGPWEEGRMYLRLNVFCCFIVCACISYIRSMIYCCIYICLHHAFILLKKHWMIRWCFFIFSWQHTAKTPPRKRISQEHTMALGGACDW